MKEGHCAIGKVSTIAINGALFVMADGGEQDEKGY